MPATVWKILNKSSPGSGTTFGADDWDMPGRYMNDVDLSATAPSSIKTNTSFWDNRLRIWNPAKTFSYRIRGSALLADRDITLPILTANDEIAMLMHASEFQNKTINVNLNTLRNTSNSIGQLLVGDGTKYLPLNMGASAGHVLTINAGVNGLEWAAPVAGGGGTNDEVVVREAGVQIGSAARKLNFTIASDFTITEDVANDEIEIKIADNAITDALTSTHTTTKVTTTSKSLLNSNIIYKDQANDFGAFHQDIGEVSTPSNPTANKLRIYMEGADESLRVRDSNGRVSNLTAGYQHRFSHKKYGSYNLITSSSGEGLFNGYLNTTGTHSRVMANTSGIRARWTTGSTSGNQAGIRTTDAITRATNDPRLVFRTEYNTATNIFLFVGFTSLLGSFPSGNNPLNTANGIGLWLDSAGFANYRVGHNNGAGGTAHEDLLPTTPITSTSTHSFEIYTDNDGTSWHVILDGTDNLVSTELPTTSADLAAVAYVETTTAAARDIDLRCYELECERA